MPSQLKDLKENREFGRVDCPKAANRKIIRLRSRLAEICDQKARLGGETQNQPENTNTFEHSDKQLLSVDGRDIDALLGGGLAIASLHEVCCDHARDAGAAAGFLLGLVARLVASAGMDRFRSRNHVIWIADPALSAENAALFPAGLVQVGLSANRFTMVHPPDLKTAMWAADEAAKCPDILANVFHVKGNPSAFNMTASRRLLLRARQSGRPTFILRQSGAEEASAADTRWKVQPATTLRDKQYEPGIGQMRHVLSLERNRNGQTGTWSVSFDPEKVEFHHAADRNITNRADDPNRHPATKQHTRHQATG